MTLKVSLLDYGAGNVRSVRNAVLAAGYEMTDIQQPSDIDAAECIIFPGVGSYASAMKVLKEKGFEEPLKRYLEKHDRPFLGICLGMQTLFESSEEVLGDGVFELDVDGRVTREDRRALVERVAQSGHAARAGDGGCAASRSRREDVVVGRAGDNADAGCCDRNRDACCDLLLVEHVQFPLC